MISLRSRSKSVMLSIFIGAMIATGCSNSGGSESSSTGGAGGAKDSGKKLVVGFAQTGAESGWRTANTESIKSEAQKRGIDLKFVDAQ